MAQIIAGVRDALSRQASANAHLRHLCFFTHNTQNYWGRAENDATPLSRFIVLLEKLPELAAEHGLRPVGATVAEVRAAYFAIGRDQEGR